MVKEAKSKQSTGLAGRLLAPLLLSLFSLALMFILLEIATRAIEARKAAAAGAAKGKSPARSWAIYDPDLGYRLRPNYNDINSYGLRDQEIQPKAGKFRILILGDSIPFYGDDIADTYPGRLEKLLGSDPELVECDVVNAGIKGYTNYQELVYLKKYGLALEPDLVGVSFCLNDLHKFLHTFEIKDGEIVAETYQFTTEAIGSVDSPLYRLARKSHFLVWLRSRLEIMQDLIEWKARDGFTFDYRPDFNTAWKDEPWKAIEEQLAEMKRVGERAGFRLFLIIFPFGDQLRRDYLARDYNYVTKPQRILKGICQRLGILALDLFNDLRRDVHLGPDRIHLTREGRALVAARIAEFLKVQQLIPSRSIAAGEKAGDRN